MSFRFKQFYVDDDRCAMKVGTDGVLLGCWCPTPHLTFDIGHLRILDIGTGSGLIALMLAQRCTDAHIDAIDIDAEAAAQAAENFAASPWSGRLHAHHCSLQEWQPEEKYHLIVSNPPYFQNSLKNPDKGRQTARHTDTLSFEELFRRSANLLAENGQLALILPAEAEAEVRGLAAAERLSLTRITRVYGKQFKPARRVLLCFVQFPVSNVQSPIIEDTLILENEIGGRSAAYQDLCKEFYL